jgi:hypothetical protein
MKTKGNHALKIMHNAFVGNPMYICRSMHILTDFVNNKTNVWSCKSEILKSINTFLKTCRIRKKKQSDTSITFDVEIEVSTGLQEDIFSR